LTNDQQHIYAHEHPETDRRRDGGFTLWFTGLSAAGKTTIAHLVGQAIEERGPIVEYLDGDTVRTRLSKGLGFSKEDRDANVERIGWVASRLTRQGAAVVASAISPYAEARAHARALVEEFGPFVEVFVDVSLEEATRRDTKGLYEKALKGEIQNFTGVNDPYERPERPDIRIDSDTVSPEESARRIVAFLEERKLIAAAAVAA
jgi:adenylylsulfate kinase